MQEQKGLLKEQDVEIDKLGDAVKRVKALGGVMRDELSEQNVLLDELEEDVDKAESGMATMQKKLKGMVDETKKSDKAMYSIMACLTMLLMCYLLFFPESRYSRYLHFRNSNVH